MKEVYVVTRSVPYGNTYIHHVCASADKAQLLAERLQREFPFDDVTFENWPIE